MAASDKKVRKEQKKRDRAKRALEKEKRRLARSSSDPLAQEEQFIDPAHTDEFGMSEEDGLTDLDFASSQRDATPENPAIQRWWHRYLELSGSERLSMVRDKLNETLDDQWREALFPEAIFEAESSSEVSDYVGFLEILAAENRPLYDTGLIWFARSRISHYLHLDAHEKIATTVHQDAAVMTETSEAFFGIMSMLRLAGLEGPADELATAGLNKLDDSDLMPWAEHEVVYYWMDSQVRRCVADGGDAKAIAKMESILQEQDVNMDADVALVRAESIRRLNGKTKTKWVRNQLVGTKQQACENRYLLSFEFARWLIAHHDIAPIAADALRCLVIETLGYERLDVRSYLNGIPKPELDEYLAGLLGFMSLDRFKAPATLIAAEHFATFLFEEGLANGKSLKRSIDTIHSLDETLRDYLSSEWSSFTFLDALRPRS